MLKLVRFLEKIEHSGHPVKVSQIDIRKRTEPDSYDVDMIVSAFDRKAPEPKPGAKADRDGGAPSASGTPAGKDADGKAADGKTGAEQ
jgi:hypothetical protein